MHKKPDSRIRIKKGLERRTGAEKLLETMRKHDTNT